MSSIQQITEKFIKGILEINIFDGLTEGLEEVTELSQEFICQVIEKKLEEADKAIFEDERRKRKWKSVQRDVKRELLTDVGQIRFKRRYYLNTITGERLHLLDNVVGIEPRERIEAGLVARLCESATENSYAKSSKICCKGQISRQTVLRKTRQVGDIAPKVFDQREDVRTIHIQADEDHVAMQDDRRATIVKLVAIHEPAKKVSKKRWQLPERYLLSSYNEDTEDFWYRVIEEIQRRYGEGDKLRVYIHGDGAPWIKSGTQYIKNSYFVLDKFHVLQKLNRVSGGYPGYKKYLWEKIENGEKEKVIEMANACANSEVCAEETAKDFISYIRNNWEGIQIWYDTEKHVVGGSCAEGLVSHILSSRLSSRPCGWLDEGLETISRLRVHVQNGERITASHVRKKKEPVIKITKKLKKAAGFGTYECSKIFHTDHRSSSRYRVFKAITEGGLAF